MRIPLSLLIALILTFPKGIGFIVYYNDLGIDKILTLLISPFLILKLTKLTKSQLIILIFLFLSTLYLGLNSWIYGLFSRQIFFFIYDLIFSLTFFYIGLYVSQNRKILLKSLYLILIFSLFFSFLSVVFNLLGIDINFLRPGEQYDIYAVRGSLGGIKIRAFMGFFSNPHRASFWFIFYKLIYYLYKSIVKVNDKIEYQFFNRTYVFLFCQLFFTILIFATQARYLTLCGILLDFIIIFQYFLNKNFRSFIYFFSISFLALIFLKEINTISNFINYGLENINTLINFNNINYDNRYKFNLLVDKRALLYTSIFENNIFHFLANYSFNPLGALFWNNKEATIALTKIKADYWDDATSLLVYFVSYGFPYLIGFLFLSFKTINSKSCLPKLIPFFVVLTLAPNCMNAGFYILTMVSSIYINFNDNIYFESKKSPNESY